MNIGDKWLKDPGAKIKTVARIFLYMGIILSIAGAIALFIVGIRMLSLENGMGTAFMLISPVAALLCVFFVWFSCIILSGYGEIVSSCTKGESRYVSDAKYVYDDDECHDGGDIDNVSGNAANIAITPTSAKNETEKTDIASTEELYDQDDTSDCEIDYVDLICSHCGEPLSFIRGVKRMECPWCGASVTIK